jgi:hypothetical protein
VKIVEVTWLDADHDLNAVTIAAIKIPGPLMTVGYLLKRDDDFTVVAMERYEGGEEYRNVTSIPSSLVKRVRTIEK